MSTTKWVIDPAHSEINFKVKHLMISNVKGSFTRFNATIQGEDFRKSTIEVTIDAASINTNNADRDVHLKSADFFDASQFESLLFTSTSFDAVDDETYQLKGQLTIKGISKDVLLDVEFGGTNKDPWGNEKMAFAVEGKINRKDWGLNWNTALETGGVLVGEEVKISADLQFIKQTS